MFVFSWMESLHLLEAVQFAWNHTGTAAGSGRTWCHSAAWRKKKVQLNQVEWRHAIAHRQSDRSPLMNATPSLSLASAVTVATPLWPAAQQCPLTPRRVDLWPEGHQAGSGGHLLLEDSKSTSLIGYHLPFPYPHLCNWHIDQLALCTLLAAPYPVYIVSEAGVWDVYTPFCKGVFVCMKQSWVCIYGGGQGTNLS